MLNYAQGEYNVKAEEVEPIFKCPSCAKKYGKKIDLDIHIKNKHEDNKNEEIKEPRPKAPKTQSKNRVL